MNSRNSILAIISILILGLSACDKKDSLEYKSLSGYWIEKGDPIGAWINFKSDQTLILSPSALMDICYGYNYRIIDNTIYLWTDQDPDNKKKYSIDLENGELTIYSLYIGISGSPDKIVFIRTAD